MTAKANLGKSISDSENPSQAKNMESIRTLAILLALAGGALISCDSGLGMKEEVDFKNANGKDDYWGTKGIRKEIMHTLFYGAATSVAGSLGLPLSGYALAQAEGKKTDYPELLYAYNGILKENVNKIVEKLPEHFKNVTAVCYGKAGLKQVSIQKFETFIDPGMVFRDASTLRIQIQKIDISPSKSTVEDVKSTLKASTDLKPPGHCTKSDSDVASPFN